MTQVEPRIEETLQLRVGELVEVRSAEEIRSTLDERGELDSLPFMPEMLTFCGRRMRVHKVAHKLCDMIGEGGLRRMERAVHLTDARCDGAAHGGCQMECSLYFKEAWLKRVTPDVAATPEPGPGDGRVLLPLLVENTHQAPAADGGERFSCQATRIDRAAPDLVPFKDPRQYVQDVRSGNAGIWATIRTIFFGLFNHFQHLSNRYLPKWLRIRGGMRWGWVQGRLTGRTPAARLELQPGELVRVRSREEIAATLDTGRLNRGMGFEEEMARFCGKTARVRARVELCMDEKTGELLRMKTPCVILDQVVCGGVYKGNCPREYTAFWREIWLERVEEPR